MQYNKSETNLSPQQWVDSLSNPESVLNISFINQGLIVLPDLSRLTNLRALLAGNNCLKELPSMCKSVEFISLYNNEFTEIPYLHPNVSQIILSDNKIIDAIIPETIESIDLSFNPLITIKFISIFRGGIIKYLGKLKTLYINHTPIQKIIGKIPKNIVEKWYDIIAPTNMKKMDIIKNHTLEICIRIKIWNTMMIYYFGRNISKRLLICNIWKVIERNVKKKYAPNKLLEILNNLGEDYTQEEFDLAICNW